MATVEDPELTEDGTGEGEAPEVDEKPKSKAQLTFEAVKEYIDQGNSKAESFEKVAADSGRSVATITTAYYRWARANEPGEIRSQPRTPRAPGTAPAAGKGKTQARAVQGGVASQLKAALKELDRQVVIVNRLVEQVVTMEKDAAGIATARKALGIK